MPRLYEHCGSYFGLLLVELGLVWSVLVFAFFL